MWLTESWPVALLANSQQNCCTTTIDSNERNSTTGLLANNIQSESERDTELVEAESVEDKDLPNPNQVPWRETALPCALF